MSLQRAYGAALALCLGLTPTTPGQTCEEEAELTPADPVCYLSGAAISMDGDRVLLGFTGIPGCAYVFERFGDAWIDTATLTLPPDDPHVNFGISVALDGDRALIGSSSEFGAAFVFEYQDGVWNRVATLEAEVIESWGGYGANVALDGDLAVVGARLTGNEGVGFAGAAHVFERVDGAWQEQARLVATDFAKNANFGGPLAIDGERILIGAAGDPELAVGAGAAYVFERIDGEWQQTAKMRAADPMPFESLGSSVALDGDLALLGAPSDNEDGTNAGAAYVFQREGEAWVEKDKLTPNPSEAGLRFGQSVAMDGELAVVGVRSSIEGFAMAYVYRYQTDKWKHVSGLLPSDSEPSDTGGGTAVALEGGTAIVGAHGPTRAYDVELGLVTHYGTSCPGSEDLRPRITLKGCLRPGGDATLSILKAYAPSQAVLWIGSSPGDTAPPGSPCSLLVEASLGLVLPISGDGPGAGEIAVPVVLPNLATTVYLQAFVADPGNSWGYSATRGLAVTLD